MIYPIKFLFILICCQIYFYLVGIIFQKICPLYSPENKLEKIFFSLTIGIIITTFLFSIYKTNFLSSQLFLLLPILFLLLENKFIRNKVIYKERIDYFSDLKIIVCVSSCVYFICFFSLTNFSLFPILNSQADYVYYSNLSYYLGVTGQENLFHVINILDKNYHGVTPYHYFELWLNTAIATMFSNNFIHNLYLVIYPVYISTILIGVMSLFLFLRFKLVTSFFVSLIFAFFSCFNLSLIFKNIKIFDTSIFCLPLIGGSDKLCYYYLFILGFIFLLRQSRSLEAIVFLLFLPITSISTLPSIAGGILIFSLVNYKFELMPWKMVKRVLIYTISILIFISFFYIIFGNSIKTEGISTKDFSGLFKLNIFSIESFKTMRNILVLSLIQIILSFSPILLVIFIFKSKLKALVRNNNDIKILIVLLSIIIIISILVWMICWRMINAQQLCYNILVVIINCITWFLFVLLLENIKNNYRTKREIIAYSFYLLLPLSLMSLVNISNLKNKVFNFYNNNYSYSKEYLESVKNYITANGVRQLGGSIYGKEDYGNIYMFSFVSLTLGHYLSFFKSGAITISLSDFNGLDIKRNELDTYRVNELIQRGVFYRYVYEQKELNDFIDIESSQVSFIKKNRLGFIIFSKNAVISSKIFELSKGMFVDPISGERFVLLN